MPTAIDRAPIKKAYNSVNTKLQDLNKQARNYNIKTILVNVHGGSSKSPFQD